MRIPSTQPIESGFLPENLVLQSQDIEDFSLEEIESSQNEIFRSYIPSSRAYHTISPSLAIAGTTLLMGSALALSLFSFYNYLRPHDPIPASSITLAEKVLSKGIGLTTIAPISAVALTTLKACMTGLSRELSTNLNHPFSGEVWEASFSRRNFLKLPGIGINTFGALIWPVLLLTSTGSR